MVNGHITEYSEGRGECMVVNASPIVGTASDRPPAAKVLASGELSPSDGVVL
jgi:hypothetical protein